jgi:ketosteroid isomerase-like protein
MKNLFSLSTLAVLALFAISCEQPAAEAPMDMEAVSAEIAALEAAYQEASNAKNVDGVMAYYADDAQSMAPLRPTMVGAAAIKARMDENMAKDTSGGSMTLAVTEVWAAGDIAVETGTWTDNDADGKVLLTGKYMSLFQKRDGKYVCIRDIWNADSKREAKAEEAGDDGEEAAEETSEE